MEAVHGTRQLRVRGPNAHLSLPSGDVGVAVAYSMILAGFSRNRIWKAFWYLLAALTCLGRMYHDQHWFSDVLLAAIISLTVGNHINNAYRERASETPTDKGSVTGAII